MVGEPGVHQGQWSRGELDAKQEQWVHKHAQHDEEPSPRPQKVMRDLHRVVPDPCLRLGYETYV